MHRKSMYKAVVAFAVALVFVTPVAAFTNFGTIGVTSDNENTGDMKNIVGTSTNNNETTTSDTSDSIEATSVNSAEDQTDIPIITSDNIDVDIARDPYGQYRYYDDGEDSGRYYESGFPEWPEWDTEMMSVADTSTYVDNSNTEVLPTMGDIIYVDDNADPSWYNETQVKTITEGITNVTVGGTVYVYNGMYYEQVVINKQLDMVGESRENVIIDGGTASGDTVSVTVDGVSISKFTVRNGGNGIHLQESSGITIENCTTYGNSQGIFLDAGWMGGGSVDENNIINCNAHNNSCGILLIGGEMGSANSNNIINCNAHNNSWDGIYIGGGFGGSADNNNIIDCDIYNNRYSISIGGYSSSADNNNITNCNVHNNMYGIHLDCASNSRLRDNTIYDNAYGFAVDGESMVDFGHDIDVTNTVDGKPIWYLVGRSGETIDETSNFGYLALISCTGMTVKNVDVNGILMAGTTDSTISNVYSYNSSSQKGIYLFDSSCNQISNCDADGFYSRYSSYNQISNCEFHDSLGSGIFLNYAYRNNFTDCNIYEITGEGVTAGIYLQRAEYNNFINCTTHDNWGRGVYLYLVPTDHNKFINCTSYNNGRVTATTTYINHGFQLYHDPNYNEFINCTSYNNTGDGFLFQDGSHNKLENCSSYNNRRHGIQFTSASDYNNITNCDFYDNRRHGFRILKSSNNNIINCRFYENRLRDGILLDRSPNNNFIECASNDNKYGIEIDRSPNCNFENTEINDNTYNFGVTGTSLTDFDQDIGPSNTINGKPIYYLVGINGFEINETHNCGYLGLISCTNIVAKNMDVYGIMLMDTTDSTLSNVSSHDSTYGIYLWQSSNNEIINGNSYDNSYGIYLTYSSSGNNLTNCNVYSNIDGIGFSDSPNNNLKDTEINNNAHNLVVTGTFLNDFDQDIDLSNTINGKTIYYLADIDGFEINETHNCGYLGLISCTNIVAKNLDVYGIMLVDTTDSTISDVSSHDSAYGIYLWQSSNNEIINGNSYDNSYGICLTYSSSGNNLTNCNVYSSSDGIGFSDSPNNNIINTDVYNTYRSITIDNSPNTKLINCNSYNNGRSGVEIESSSNTDLFNCRFYDNYYYNLHGKRSSSCNIINCNFTNSEWGGAYLFYFSNSNFINCSFYNNAKYGIYIKTGSNDNSIHHNNFVNNDENAYDQSSNIWDDGSEGNYWDDYTGVDEDPEDGIGDTPYSITGGSNQDRYPLMVPVGDTAHPLITEVTLTTSDPLDTDPLYGWENFTCTVTGDIAVSQVKLIVTNDTAATVEYVMTNIPETDMYYYNTTITQCGVYNYSIWAEDTSENNATSPLVEFELPPNWDVSMNGRGYLEDFVLVAGHYGETGSKGWIREDVSNNGKAYLEDFVLIAGHYGERWK